MQKIYPGKVVYNNRFLNSTISLHFLVFSTRTLNFRNYGGCKPMDSVQNEITHKNYYAAEMSLENYSCMRFPVVHWAR